MYHRKAHAGSGSKSFGGKERLKNTGEHLRGHSGTSVTDHQVEIMTRWKLRFCLLLIGKYDRSEGNEKLSTILGHSMAGIGAEIH